MVNTRSVRARNPSLPLGQAHNSTSTTNQDVVAAQLAAMQQQFGVFQLVLAQLLARNNPGDPLINLLNPTQQPLAPQQNPQPVQHALALSESQGQSHIAPAQQPLPDKVTRRLDSLKKLVAEQRGAPPPHHAVDSIPHPLNTNITLEPYSIGFKIPQLETYDGTKDPDDHLHAFYSCMQAQNASDALMFKIFPSTFRGNARTCRRLIRKTTSELMRVKQRDGESLKNYMSKFNDAVLERQFDQNPSNTFSEVNDRSLKFITVEEYALAQNPTPSKNQNPDWRDENLSRKRMRMTQNRDPMPTSTLRFGRPNLAPPQQFAEQRLQPQGVRNPPNRQGVGYQQVPPLLPPQARIIHMITGGLEAGGLSSKQKKLYVREVKHQNRAQKWKFDDADWKNQLITFTSTDFDTVVIPHNDPLVTFVMINNCEIQRVLVDTESAPDIMYFHCFESLGLDPALLQRYDGPIYGFNNQPAQVEGVLTLHVAFGSGRTYVIPSVRFLVVKIASSFNVVIGRPTLTEIRAVVSQSHLCMKFPTPMGIATLRGNQETPEAIPQRIPDNQQVMDMPGIPNSVSQHKFSTNPLKKPVAQKRRLFGGERLQVIKEEVEKLLQADFVRKVDYCEWVANPVLVKKANGKWPMCIDYTNLNQACPKDCYPMSSIDKLVEAASGNERLSLLDAYYGYHQVPMALKDEEKTSFYAGDEIYCYVMMPFGLKNAAEDHLADLDETFNNLKKNKMRLNPAKCIFGVEFGKFLGFMVSRRGIEVNPEKIRAIAEMKLPKSVKDIQSSPPLLTKAIDEEILYLYLGISDETISSVLVRKEAKQQKPIYYISSVLHGAELRYPIAEKAALAVILQKLECSGRLIKWAVELGEFEITFQQRSAIRAQALVDFIVECTPCHSTPNPEPNDWTLYVDGASSSKGSGAGALLIGPDGYQSEHALKFNFDATNNMAEYETLLLGLLLGLQLALELKISAIQVYSDSQLVVNQINSICEVVGLVMVKYVALVVELNSLSSRLVFVEVLDEPSFMKPRMMEISIDPDMPSWTDSIISFLRDGIVFEDRQEAMKLRKKASRHVGARTLAHKVVRQGYYWLNMYKDATHFVQRCPKCQFFAHLTHQPAEELTNLVEARPLFSLTSKKVEDFVFSSIICRYGISNQIVADNGTQFNCISFRDFCSSYEIELQFTSVYHPESNGMVEFVNKCILEGIKPRLEQHKAKWADKLNNVLWAYRTTSRTATGETPYHLAFGTEAIILIEIGVSSFWVTHFDEGRNGQLLWENLDLLAEVREEARL
ncbi:hypothetical protein SLEP1_g4466 [Rubroshorea leprosula]|uniref:Uncharacterized protein n=1 Tax=Rubroshorea leprosula TaxID=152421 RepID=A0AAV5HT45_9ROSI|nr:hypothetical protein SLEP1_g4466 [Rubroshorea leprosula]